MIQLAPSILNSNLTNLELELQKISQADWLHLDVMDGHFVPNLTFGPMFVSALKKVSTLPIEAHLMVEHPEIFIPLYAAEGCQRIIIHAEASQHLHRLIQMIKEQGCEAGIAFNPATSLDCLQYLLPDLDLVLLMTVNPGFGGQKLIPSVLSKIEQLREMVTTQQHLDCQIEVDGGIHWDNIKTVIEAGANIIVAGTLIFNDPNAEATVLKLKSIIRASERY